MPGKNGTNEMIVGTDAIFVGVDDGFRQIKLVTNTGLQLCLPSVVRQGFSLSIIGDGEDSGSGGYETEKRQFTVDPSIDGEDTRFDDWCLSPINRVLVHHALHQAGLGGQKIVLGTGLPFETFFKPGTSEPNEEKIFAKMANLEVPVSALNGEDSPIVLRQQINAQGLAAYIDYLTNDSGEIREGVDSKLPVAIIDIGGRTTDTVTVLGGGKLDHASSGTGDVGISNVYDVILNEMKPRFSVANIKLSTLDVAARKRSIRLRGADHDVGDIVDKAVAEISDQVIREVKRRIGDAAEMEKVILVGGGAMLMKEHIAKVFPHCYVPPAPEFSNARGMCKYVQHFMS